MNRSSPLVSHGAYETLDNYGEFFIFRETRRIALIMQKGRVFWGGGG